MTGWLPARRSLAGVAWVGGGAAVTTTIERRPAGWVLTTGLWVLVVLTASLAWAATRGPRRRAGGSGGPAASGSVPAVRRQSIGR